MTFGPRPVPEGSDHHDQRRRSRGAVLRTVAAIVPVERRDGPARPRERWNPMRRTVAWAAILTLLLTFAPTAASGPAAAVATPAPLIGLVADGPVLYDRGYNQQAWLGVTAGAKAINGRANVLLSSTARDYAINIRSLVARGAKAIVTVGFVMANATVAAAKLYPRVQFIGIDQQPARPLPRNYQGLDFDRGEAGYLAGIVAGWTTTTDKVGVVGGMASRPVLAFINGYRNGVASVKATTKVVTLYADSFSAPDLGEASANALIADGADVVFGVAGQAGAGVHAAACTAGKWSIGVDVDEYLRYPAYQACIVTSAMNRIALATAKAIRRWSNGRPGFQTGIYLNGAWNLAMPLAPIRNVTPPAELTAALNAAFAGLKNGTIDPCRPTACTTK
jgi:basic membrane protein A